MATNHHMHVYFHPLTERDAAMQLRKRVAERFPSAVLGRVHEQAMAFHPAPMYQVALHGVGLGVIVDWLERHRGDLSVLVHPLTGDAFAEHVDRAVWLGRPLPMDHDRLRAVASAAPSETAPAGPSILRIDASARREGSQGRRLADALVEQLTADRPDVEVVARDLADGVPLLDAETLAAWPVAIEERSEAEASAAGPSDTFVAELQQAEAIVIALPIYNFGVPAAFKAWIDQVARARVTFRYSENGPVGLLADRPVYVVVTSGGTRLGSPIDFVSPWLRHVLGFLGLHDVRIIEADGLAFGADARMAEAMEAVRAVEPLRRLSA